MKYLYFILAGIFLTVNAAAQQSLFKIHDIPLPAAIKYDENQFSGLYVRGKQLFLMPECRLQQGHEAKLYVMNLGRFKKNGQDTAFNKRWKKIPIYQLDRLRNSMDASGNEFEGLEAIVVDGNAVYLSVETSTASPNCFLLKGILSDTALTMDTSFMVPLPKYKGADGRPVYNAGFEAVARQGAYFYAFYEYNYFDKNNELRVLDKFSFLPNGCAHALPLQKMPFRITDITSTGSNSFTALNYFYQGGGADTVYRVPPSDTASYHLTVDSGRFVPYCRLVNLELREDHMEWNTLWEFPKQYRMYNWEGIASWKNGFFIINDKYSAKPYRSTLLYLEKE
ncbi:MAG: hypothetical protein U0V75_04740 [Ferruginibacter sp.]